MLRIIALICNLPTDQFQLVDRDVPDASLAGDVLLRRPRRHRERERRRERDRGGRRVPGQLSHQLRLRLQCRGRLLDSG